MLVELLSAPYELGQPLVDRIIEDRGNEGLAAALADPPHTSEQVVDPDAYEAGETAVDVPHPQPGGTLVDEGVVGQLLIQMVLAPEMAATRPARRRTAGAATGPSPGGTATARAPRSPSWATTPARPRSCAKPSTTGPTAATASTIPPSGGGPFTVQSCV